MWFFPFLKRGTNYRGITLLSLPGKVYSRVLGRRVRLLVEPRIQEEQYGFRTGHGILDQLYTLARVLEGGPGSLPNQSTCVLWIWRRLMTRSLKVSCAGCSESMEWTAFCYGLSNLCIIGVRAWFALPAVNQIHSQSGLMSAKDVLCQWLCS